MKKWVAFLMAAVMMLGCFAGSFAEETDPSEETMLLQILGEEPVNLYADAGDTEASDTIDGGRICGMLEKTAKDETEWYQIVFLDKDGEGQTAFLPAESAKRLTMEELAELMKDPEKANEILDLIDAVNKMIEEKTKAENNTAASGGNSFLAELYEQAMGLLGQVKAASFETELGNAAGEAGKIAGQVLETGKEMADEVSKEGGELINQGMNEIEKNLPDVKEKVSEMNPDEVSELLDSLKEKYDELEKASGDGIPETMEKVKELLDELGGGTGVDSDSVNEKLNELINGAQEALDNKALYDVQGIAKDVSAILDEGTAENLEGIIEAALQLMNQSGNK